MKFASQTLFFGCLCLLFFLPAGVQAINPLDFTQGVWKDSSFQDFPFASLAEEVGIFDLPQLALAKKALDGQNLEGGQFL
ncbi:MAG: hypothetical protein AAGH79_06025, partial [Bacteroidota bacterium]